MNALKSAFGRAREFTYNENPTIPPITELFDMLSSERRCRVIEAIDEHGPMQLRELADEMAELEHGPRYTQKMRKSVYVSLYQQHLEPLRELGIVEFDHRSRSYIRPGPHFEGTVGVLEHVREQYEGEL